VARQHSPRVSVVETSVASKVCALNMGDELAHFYPRIYMDADICLSDDSFGVLEASLSSGPWLAVSPDPVMDLSSSSWPVRAYYDIWLSMPYCRKGMLGAGVYALSEEGRRRFEKFPDLIADDGYVRALFKEHERGKVEAAKAIVKAPANLYWLIKIKTRSRLGAMQLRLKYPELVSNEEKNYSGALLSVLASPGRWFKFAVYAFVNLASRFFAKRKLAELENYQWEKDVSSRKPKADFDFSEG
jgi:hypothetical protein